MAGADSPVQIWIRWPGGKSFTLDVPTGAAEVEIAINGEIARVK